MQGWSLEEKIKVSQMKILEWYRAYNGQVFTSFSGGKDSTVLLDLARQVCPDIPAVYVDTGLEYPELRDFVKTKDNVIWLLPGYIRCYQWCPEGPALPSGPLERRIAGQERKEVDLQL